MQRIEQDGEWEWERLLAEWGKSGQPRLFIYYYKQKSWLGIQTHAIDLEFFIQTAHAHSTVNLAPLCKKNI